MESEEWEATCREAVYQWIITGMKEWIGNHSKGNRERVFNIEDWVAMLESEAPDVFIIMLNHSQSFIPAVEDGRVTAT